MAPAGNSARVGSYVLGTKLQSTKTFEVWQSRHVNVAYGSFGLFIVKRLLPELAENPRLLEQYAQRGERAKRLCHEGIASVVDVVVDGEDCCIVSDFVRGFSLRHVLDRLRSCDNALPVWFAVHVARKLSEALEHAHDGGPGRPPPEAIYHQDVSAENVIISESGQVKLIDFGLSRAALLGIEATGTRRWSDSGEFDLWAPHFGDALTDIQGLGRVFYELLAGVPPARPYVPPSHHASWVVAELDRVVHRMLSTNASDRFTRIRDLREALDDIASRQRQSVDATHLSSLLSVVMSSLPVVQREPVVSMAVESDVKRRTETILPASIIEVSSVPPPATPAEFTPTTSAPPPSGRISRHDWDAAIDSVRRAVVDESPVASTNADANAESTTNVETDSPAKCATESFERGLEQLRLGDLQGAESYWQQALELDPNHRLCQVNLKLLRKRRDSERPLAAQ